MEDMSCIEVTWNQSQRCQLLQMVGNNLRSLFYDTGMENIYFAVSQNLTKLGQHFIEQAARIW